MERIADVDQLSRDIKKEMLDYELRGIHLNDDQQQMIEQLIVKDNTLEVYTLCRIFNALRNYKEG